MERRRIEEEVSLSRPAISAFPPGSAGVPPASPTGPLCDHVFTPLLVRGGSLANSLGPFLGVGPGRGIGLLFIVVGALLLVTVAGAAVYEPLRVVERQ